MIDTRTDYVARAEAHNAAMRYPPALPRVGYLFDAGTAEYAYFLRVPRPGEPFRFTLRRAMVHTETGARAVYVELTPPQVAMLETYLTEKSIDGARAGGYNAGDG